MPLVFCNTPLNVPLPELLPTVSVTAPATEVSTVPVPDKASSVSLLPCKSSVPLTTTSELSSNDDPSLAMNVPLAKVIVPVPALRPLVPIVVLPVTLNDWWLLPLDVSRLATDIVSGSDGIPIVPLAVMLSLPLPPMVTSVPLLGLVIAVVLSANVLPLGNVRPALNEVAPPRSVRENASPLKSMLPLSESAMSMAPVPVERPMLTILVEDRFVSSDSVRLKVPLPVPSPIVSVLSSGCSVMPLFAVNVAAILIESAVIVAEPAVTACVNDTLSAAIVKLPLAMFIGFV